MLGSSLNVGLRIESVKPNTHTTKNSKGKSVIDESSKHGATCVECFRYQYGYIVAQCLIRILSVERAQLEDDEFEEEIYEVVGNASDSNEDVRVFSILLGVVKCLYTTFRDKNQYRSNIFHITLHM